MKNKYLFTVIMLFFIFVSVNAVNAANITVVPGPDAIKNAINEASSGDTLDLTPGTYYEHDIIVHKNLILKGPKPILDFPPTAIIDAEYKGRVFEIPKGVNITLKYLTIQNGIAYDPNGGGIVNSGKLNVDTCVIRQNKAFIGGGIENCDGATLTLYNSTVRDNIADDRGGGVSNYYGGDMTINKSFIFNNLANSSGGGIYNYGTMTINNSNIYNNNVLEYGGGISNINSLNLLYSNVYGNSATIGGGAIQNCEILRVINSNILGNSADEGAGILNYGYICDIDGTTIKNNNANYNGGGIKNSWIMDILNSKIYSNTAKNSGGGIYNDDTLTINYTDIATNKAVDGAGIYNTGSITINNSTINSNIATKAGGGINNIGNIDLRDSNINQNKANKGGGIFNDNTMNLNDADIFYNTAESGAGIVNNGEMDITDSEIYINSANNDGGAIINKGYMTLNNCEIYKNKAFASIGGAIENIGDMNLYDVNIYNNTASKYGGGIHNNGNMDITSSNVYGNISNYGAGIANYENLTITDSSVYKNIAKIKGGGVYNQAYINVTNSNFTLNSALYGGAVYNYGDLNTRVLNFNRFYLDSATLGSEIYSEANSLVDAKFNWWGSNNNPSTKIYGTVNFDPWMILNINASSILIKKNGTSNITVNLRYDSDGTYHNPIYGHVPDGIPVIFKTSFGSINSPVNLTEGASKAILRAGTTSGTANINATLDNATVKTSVTIDAVSPTITSITPLNNTVGVPVNQIIKITFSESIKPSIAFSSITIKNSNGSQIPITRSISGNVLTITSNTPFINGAKYTITIPKGSIKDLAGNELTTTRVYYFTVAV